MGLVILFAVAGAAAQLVDGTLGMGFGVVSATLLLLLGASPAAASAATHAAKLPTTLTSGLAHWRAGNVDPRMLVRLALPGMVAAFLGAVVLTGLSMAAARGWMSGLLIFFGVTIVLRFGFGVSLFPVPTGGTNTRWLAPIGALGGFVDSTGGGGWGPVVTPSLLTVTRHSPRVVVGTVSAAEFLVAVAASAGFLTGAAQYEVPWLAVLGLVVGGVLVAPVAARLVGRLNQAFMGTLVGGFIVVTNGIGVAVALGVSMGAAEWLLCAAVLVATLLTAARAKRREAAGLLVTER